MIRIIREVYHLRYQGPIPKNILFRAQDFANFTGLYIAFDKDGTCYAYPSKPILLKRSGCWSPAGRRGLFQREEIKFTKRKYKFDNWDTLISPSKERVRLNFTHKTYNPTRSIPRNTFV